MTVLAMKQLAVEAGEIVALLGANGSGKTELLETVLGFRAGSVRLFERDVSLLATERRVALGAGYVPEGRRVFAGLTVRENLEASCSLPTAERRHRLDEVLALFPMLAERPEAERPARRTRHPCSAQESCVSIRRTMLSARRRRAGWTSQAR